MYLHLPIDVSFTLLQEKSLSQKKKYLEGKKDLAESNIKHLQESQKSAVKIVQENNKWIQIECSENNQIMTREEIHEKIFLAVRKVLKIIK